MTRAPSRHLDTFPPERPLPILDLDATGRPLRYHGAPRLPDGPLDLSRVIAGDGPLELDIGFGRGRSLLERALAAPHSRIVGVEIKRKWAWIVEQRRIAAGLDHARAFAGDVRELLPRCGPDGCVSRVFLHFPDPWWKKRHARRMVLGDPFLEQLARLLARGTGELFVQTDVEDRGKTYLDRVERFAVDGAPAFENAAGPGRFLDHNPFGARSGREARCEADGLPIYRILVRRRASPPSG